MPRRLHYKAPPRGGRKVFLATPAFGDLSASYVYALFASQQALSDAGIDADFEILSGNCHVDDSRNILVRDFLNTDCEELIFLDADVRWNPSELVRLIQHDKDVVAGIYPLKEEAESYPVRMIDGDIYAFDGLIEVEGVPTGFLKIKRHVLEKLSDIVPGFKGKSDIEGKRLIPLIFERTLENQTRWGGDYEFCRKWKAVGGKIYIDPEMTFEHVGETQWNGKFGDFLRNKNNIDNPLLIKSLTELKSGNDGSETFAHLFKEWGNQWAASPELLAAIYLMAKETEGNILETGSGISTLVLGMTGKKIYSLECDFAWYRKVRKLLDKFGLDNVNLVYAPIDPLTMFYSMPALPVFSLAICDGPTRDIGREGFYKLPQIRNATLIIDDSDSELKHVRDMGNIEITKLCERRPFAIIRRQNDRKLSEAQAAIQA